MDSTTLSVLRLLHILFTAVWFGAGLTIAGDVRRTLERGKPHTDALGERVNRSLGMVMGAGVATVVTGFALVFARGGFGAVGPAIHTSILLSLGILGIDAVGKRGTWKTIEGQLGTDAGITAAKKLSGRLAMFSGIGHLLWLVTLGLMVFAWAFAMK
jgi:hypothetical protein